MTGKTSSETPGGARLLGHAPDPCQRRAARVAGALFLLIVTGWTLNWIFVDSKLYGSPSAAAAADAVMAREPLFRVGLADELLFAVAGLALALWLYGLLKPLRPSLARLALCLKLLEAAVAIVSVLAAFMALQLLHGRAALAALEPERLRELAGLFLRLRSNGAAVAMVFLGLGFTVFFCLLYRSGYVPRLLAGFGVFSYCLIFVKASLDILVPRNGEALAVAGPLGMALMAPSVLFELAIGLRLLIKGVRPPDAGEPA